MAPKRYKIRHFGRGEGNGLVDDIRPIEAGWLRAIVLILAAVLILRLFSLTVIEGKKNRILAEENRIRLVKNQASRGNIFDRNGTLLAYSALRFFLQKDGEVRSITAEQARVLEERGVAGSDFVGELGQIKKEVVRVYPFGQTMAHVIGYLGAVSSGDLARNQKLAADDVAGRLGVEETYDDTLRGRDGKKIIEVDAEGKIISILGQTVAVSGRDIYLTIDARLQQAAFEALQKTAAKLKTGGALVIAEPASGEILAMVSLPSFDPDEVSQAIDSPDKPLFNRAVAANFPPGSIFKIVSALGGLASGKINGETEIEDVGEFKIGETRFANWYWLTSGRRDGILKVDRAIARSNDIFFYRLGERTGLAPIQAMALKLGFGQKTGVDLPEESFGVVPDEVWKKANLGQGWFLGDTLQMAIGQGYVLATPIQINKLTTAVAGGVDVKPSLVAKIVGEHSRDVVIKKEINNLGLVGADLSLVRDGMKQACQTGGTGWPFFNASYVVGCKTGTAEKALGNPHAWFTAFAPFEDPQLAITVLVEDGGEGSSVAAPIAREILDWWFQNK